MNQANMPLALLIALIDFIDFSRRQCPTGDYQSTRTKLTSFVRP